MKGTKTIALILSAAMIAGIFTGCGSKTTKITTDKFIKACEKLDLKDFEYGGRKEPDADDFGKGFYVYADEDTVEDNADDFDEFLTGTGLDDVFEAENIKSFAFAAKCDGFDYDDLLDMSYSGGMSDLELDGAVAFQMTLDDNYAEDLMAYMEDQLERIDVSTDDLSDKEYYLSKNEGYLRFHADIGKTAEYAFDNDVFDQFFDYIFYFSYGFLAGAEDLTGDVAFSFEISGNCIFFIAGFNINTEDSTVVKDFVKAFGAACNPMDIPANDQLVEDIVDKALDGLGDWIEPFPTDVVTPPTNPGYTSAGKVGVSMPTKDLMRWNQDGDYIKYCLNILGYEVDLRYAANDTQTQVSQIEDMIYTGCDVLIIAPIAGETLTEVLDLAKSAGVTVIDYDRLIENSDAVDYYVTFDNYMVGALQAQYIVNSLQLDSAQGTYNIEITTGDPSDVQAGFFFTGAMDVLKPYIDANKVNVVSGQMTFAECATNVWSTDNARSRAETIIGNFYSDGKSIDAWLCTNDSTALGVIQALEATYPSSAWPVITGMDCDMPNVKYILEGKQAMSAFKDTRTLAAQAAYMASQILSGSVVDTNGSYNNGSREVPAYLCEPLVVDVNNYREILIDSGYYTEDQLT